MEVALQSICGGMVKVQSCGRLVEILGVRASHHVAGKQNNLQARMMTRVLCLMRRSVQI